MMAGGNGKWLLVFAMFLVAARAQAPSEGAVEVTPFVGYRFGGDLGDVENGGSASVSEGSCYGIMLDWEVAKDAFVELRYSRQETELEARGSSFDPGMATITDMKVEHYFLGGTYQWESQGPFRPFVGADPFALQKQAQQQAQQSEQAKQQAQKAGTGAGASGAVKGAAAGALIGEIASDDAGKGAAYGAAAGVIAGRRKGRAAKEQATEQAEKQGQQAQQATQQQMDNFKKAFSVCLEAKNYMVKY